LKLLFRKLFSPILNLFESGQAEYVYKKSHRVILIVMGLLFNGLASLVFVLSHKVAQDVLADVLPEVAQVSTQANDIGYLIPVVFFGGAGILCLLIGLLGNDRAVAKIWGS